MQAALPLLLLVLAANDDTLRAQEEIERNLKSMGALPPPALTLTLSPPAQRGFDVLDATFEVDAQPTPRVPVADLVRGAKAFDKEVSAGTHSIAAKVLVSEKEAALLDDFAVRKVTLEGRVALRTPRGIKLHVAVALRVNRDEADPSKRYRLVFDQTPELLQTTDQPLLPPPPKVAVPAPDAGSPAAAALPPPPPPPAAAEPAAGPHKVAKKKKKRALQLARAIARTGVPSEPEAAEEAVEDAEPEPPDAGLPAPQPPAPPPPPKQAPPPAARQAAPTVQRQAEAFDAGVLIGGGGVVLVLLGLVLAIRRR